MKVYFFKKLVLGICFRASFLFFAARSRQRLNTSTSVAVASLCCAAYF
jgi:hypothetical protein